MDYIYHHGIKGQKWGVRRTPEELGHGPSERQRTSGETNGSKSEKTREHHADYDRAHDKKRVEDMSDQELRERLNRLNMEQQYNKMNPSSIERGRKILLGTVAALGTTVAVLNNVQNIYNKYNELKRLMQKK